MSRDVIEGDDEVDGRDLPAATVRRDVVEVRSDGIEPGSEAAALSAAVAPDVPVRTWP